MPPLLPVPDPARIAKRPGAGRAAAPHGRGGGAAFDAAPPPSLLRRRRCRRGDPDHLLIGRTHRSIDRSIGVARADGGVEASEAELGCVSWSEREEKRREEEGVVVEEGKKERKRDDLYYPELTRARKPSAL